MCKDDDFAKHYISPAKALHGAKVPSASSNADLVDWV